MKNLSNKVHQQDLESLFNKFLPEGAGGIEYRVLTGRMRGQAFITFPGNSLIIFPCITHPLMHFLVIIGSSGSLTYPH